MITLLVIIISKTHIDVARPIISSWDKNTNFINSKKPIFFNSNQWNKILNILKTTVAFNNKFMKLVTDFRHVKLI